MESQHPVPDHELDRARQRLVEERSRYRRARRNLDSALERAIEEGQDDDEPGSRRVAQGEPRVPSGFMQ